MTEEQGNEFRSIYLETLLLLCNRSGLKTHLASGNILNIRHWYSLQDFHKSCTSDSGCQHLEIEIMDASRRQLKKKRFSGGTIQTHYCITLTLKKIVVTHDQFVFEALM